jgi:DNA ligase D-like protein (predicted ligase)
MQLDNLENPPDPMLAQSRPEPPVSSDYLYEVKWDGIRATIVLDEGELVIWSRNRREITHLFPELLNPTEAFRAACGIYDGEIVCLDDQGKPMFEEIIRRLHTTGAAAINRVRTRSPAVCYLFDCLYLDGISVMHEPLERRREWLKDSLRPNSPFRFSEAVREGGQLFDAASKLGLEGIMAKEILAPYLPGRRGPSWLKIKARRTMECIILGYTPGRGDRERLFGALHLGIYKGTTLKYLGRVGTGFTDLQLKRLKKELDKLDSMDRLMLKKPKEDAGSVWLEPLLVCEVSFASLTADGSLREPVFLRLRPDRIPSECRGEF